MGKPTICIGENKGTDQLRSNCEADQRLCFRYSDSTVPLLLKSKISSFWSFLGLYSLVCVRLGRNPELLVFSCTHSFGFCYHIHCVLGKLSTDKVRVSDKIQSRPGGYKTFFTLISAETKIYPGDKCKNANNLSAE